MFPKRTNYYNSNRNGFNSFINQSKPTVVNAHDKIVNHLKSMLTKKKIKIKSMLTDLSSWIIVICINIIYINIHTYKSNFIVSKY